MDISEICCGLFRSTNLGRLLFCGGERSNVLDPIGGETAPLDGAVQKVLL